MLVVGARSIACWRVVIAWRFWKLLGVVGVGGLVESIAKL